MAPSMLNIGLCLVLYASVASAAPRECVGQEFSECAGVEAMSLLQRVASRQKNVESGQASWITGLRTSEWRRYSQNGEDGVIFALIGNLSISSKYYVEFGVEDGMQRNTRAIQESLGWTGLLLDGSNRNPDINLHEEMITEENIANLFQAYEVPDKFGLLSVDIDSYDFWVLRKILESGYKPDLIITEVNSQIEPGLFTIAPSSVTQVPWIRPGVSTFGATPEAFAALVKAHGYIMVYCESAGVNCFYVRQSLLNTAELASIPSHLRQLPRYSAMGGLGYIECWPKPAEAIQWYKCLTPDCKKLQKDVSPNMIENCLGPDFAGRGPSMLQVASSPLALH